jgi:hypothetical protein
MKKILRVLGWFLAGVFVLVAGIFILFNLPFQTPRQDIHLGMTFSYRYAESLGLNWQETYLAQLDDLHIRRMRIPVYWDLVEKNEGELSYTEVDWQLEQIAARKGEVILSLGQRVPRWPECHIPTWAKDDTSKREQKLLEHIERSVLRYRDHQEITT